MSFGLTIDSVGTLTTDDYGFADTQVSVSYAQSQRLQEPLVSDRRLGQAP